MTLIFSEVVHIIQCFYLSGGNARNSKKAVNKLDNLALNDLELAVLLKSY